MVYLTKVYEFSASHRLHSPENSAMWKTVKSSENVTISTATGTTMHLK